MRPLGAVAIILMLLVVALAGCAKPKEDAEPRIGRVPFGWDEDAPERSHLATQSYYVLDQSSSFLVKGATYARYIVRVDETLEGVELFFTSTNSAAPNATHPNVNDATYHYEFMQIRRLGTSVRVMDVSAAPAFSNANTGRTFTLAYVYGRGANYQYLAPYQGDPGNWRLDPGFYELIIATDERLTVGVNMKIGTPLWSTHYYPQELGEARSESLQTYAEIFPGAAPPALSKSFGAYVEVNEGEILNYFAFSNLIHRSNVVAVGTEGTVRVEVDDSAVPHRLQPAGVEPQRTEAYAYAVSFNEPGPARHTIRTEFDFRETVSVQSDLSAQMLLFAIVVRPLSTLDGLPSE